jgi:hypothetical protein
METPRDSRRTKIVIAGLDPAIHRAAAQWMPGSSPGMTTEGHQLSESEY